jgi:hypothetical protein
VGLDRCGCEGVGSSELSPTCQAAKSFTVDMQQEPPLQIGINTPPRSFISGRDPLDERIHWKFSFLHFQFFI